MGVMAARKRMYFHLLNGIFIRQLLKANASKCLLLIRWGKCKSVNILFMLDEHNWETQVPESHIETH